MSRALVVRDVKNDCVPQSFSFAQAKENLILTHLLRTFYALFLRTLSLDGITQYADGFLSVNVKP